MVANSSRALAGPKFVFFIFRSRASQGRVLCYFVFITFSPKQPLRESSPSPWHISPAMWLPSPWLIASNRTSENGWRPKWPQLHHPWYWAGILQKFDNVCVPDFLGHTLQSRSGYTIARVPPGLWRQSVGFQSGLWDPGQACLQPSVLLSL